MNKDRKAGDRSKWWTGEPAWIVIDNKTGQPKRLDSDYSLLIWPNKAALDMDRENARGETPIRVLVTVDTAKGGQ